MKTTEKKMYSLKSRYDLTMERFEKEGLVTVFNAQENAAIISGFNTGTEEFLYEQKFNEKASELELNGIILNA